MPKFNYQKAKSQMAPEAVRAYLDSHPGLTMSAADSVALRKDLQAAKKQGPGWDMARGFVNTLPTQGGIVGGSLGGLLGAGASAPLGGEAAWPAGAAGAALGGAAGQNIRNLLAPAVGLESPQGVGNQALNVAGEGAIQGGAYLGGEALAKGAQMGAQGIMQAALGKGAAPEAVSAALKEKIQTTRGGLARLNQRINRAARVVRNMRADAAARGAKWDPWQMAGEVWQQLVPEIKGQTVSKQDAASLLQQTLDFGHTQGGAFVGPEALNTIRQYSDELADPIHKAIDLAEQGAGPPVPPAMKMQARYHKAVADAARQRLNQIGFDPLTNQSAYAKANDQLGQLMDVRSAIAPRVGLSAGARLAAAGPAAAIGALAPFGSPIEHAVHGAVLGALAQPEALSGTAILMSQLSPMLRGVPQFATGALESTRK